MSIKQTKMKKKKILKENTFKRTKFQVQCKSRLVCMKKLGQFPQPQFLRSACHNSLYLVPLINKIKTQFSFEFRLQQFLIYG